MSKTFKKVSPVLRKSASPQIRTITNYELLNTNWTGYVGSTALGCNTEKKLDSNFWFFAFLIALFS